MSELLDVLERIAVALEAIAAKDTDPIDIDLARRSVEAQEKLAHSEAIKAQAWAQRAMVRE